MQFVEMVKDGNLTGDDNTNKPVDAKLDPPGMPWTKILSLNSKIKFWGGGFEGSRIDSPLPPYTFSP